MENKVEAPGIELSATSQILRSELRALKYQILNVAHRLMAIDILLSDKPEVEAAEHIPPSGAGEHTPPSGAGGLPDAIINIVCNALNVTLCEIKNGEKTQRITDARALLSYFLRQHTQLTMLKIIEIMNFKNHTTVIAHLKKVNDLPPFNKAFADKKNLVENLINKLCA